ncbi:unnamed protein product [Durusdinium trenchii]|uniref:Uncharacterized protein n=1 Tax=Durusdinium trenchii TaxID=1381693 RepID=A0ABP0NEM0_9DINO
MFSKLVIFIQISVVFGIRADTFSNTSVHVTECAEWYEGLPKKWKIWKLGARREYIEKNPDPCAANGMECCKGKCSLKGCPQDLSCADCKASMSDVPADAQKAICEDKTTCNSFVGGCLFLGGACENQKQSCHKCTEFYQHDLAKAKEACGDTSLCYWRGNSAYSNGDCKWNDDSKKCEYHYRLYHPPS